MQETIERYKKHKKENQTENKAVEQNVQVISAFLFVQTNYLLETIINFSQYHLAIDLNKI